VAARALPRGAALQAGDLRAEARTAWGPPARTPEQTPAPGWELRRPVAAGQSLAWPASAPPPLVRAGEPVRVEWRRGAVTVATSGVAQNAARAGETVRVRVPGRLGRLQGSATGPGTVTLVDGGGR
jgi:flagella basal body P-ring formation protein FlgA